MGKIISVISGKGGAGKTTLSVNLSRSFKKLSLKTLLIDMSFGVRNSDVYLGATSHGIYNIYDILTGASSYKDAIITFDDEVKPDFIMPSLRDIEFDYKDRFNELLNSLKDVYDYIVIDTPSCVSREFSLSCEYSDIILLCVTDEYMSVENSSLCLGRISDIESKDKYIVINKFIHTYSKDDKCAEDYADEMSVGIIGVINYDANMDSYMKNSQFDFDKSDNEFLNIAKRICSIYPEYNKHSFIDGLFGKKK